MYRLSIVFLLEEAAFIMQNNQNKPGCIQRAKGHDKHLTFHCTKQKSGIDSCRQWITYKVQTVSRTALQHLMKNGVKYKKHSLTTSVSYWFAVCIMVYIHAIAVYLALCVSLGNLTLFIVYRMQLPCMETLLRKL